MSTCIENTQKSTETQISLLQSILEFAVELQEILFVLKDLEKLHPAEVAYPAVTDHSDWSLDIPRDRDEPALLAQPTQFRGFSGTSPVQDEPHSLPSPAEAAGACPKTTHLSASEQAEYQAFLDEWSDSHSDSEEEFIIGVMFKPHSKKTGQECSPIPKILGRHMGRRRRLRKSRFQIHSLPPTTSLPSPTHIYNLCTHPVPAT